MDLTLPAAVAERVVRARHGLSAPNAEAHRTKSGSQRLRFVHGIGDFPARERPETREEPLGRPLMEKHLAVPLDEDERHANGRYHGCTTRLRIGSGTPLRVRAAHRADRTESTSPRPRDADPGGEFHEGLG